MNRVFIPQEPQKWDSATSTSYPLYDFTPALRYGALEVCLAPNASFLMIAPVTAALKERMRSFTDDDYLVAVGSPVMIALSAAIASERTGGKFNLLSYDKRMNEYLNTRIEITK